MTGPVGGGGSGVEPFVVECPETGGELVATLLPGYVPGRRVVLNTHFVDGDDLVKARVAVDVKGARHLAAWLLRAADADERGD